MSLTDTHDALLLDLDGTVWEGGVAIAEAVESITDSGIAALYITNNASRSPVDVAEKLGAIGLPVDPSRVLTSSLAAASLARELYPEATRALVVGTAAFRDIARDSGFTVVDSADDRPQVVLHGHNPETGWAQLTEAAMAISAGAKYVASNMDTTLPTERGLAVGNGSMVAAVVSATGVTPAVAGKPQPTMFRQAAEVLGSQSPLAIGDRLDTDIEGAVAAGMLVLHVLTGVSGHYALLTAPAHQRPTYVAGSMAALTQEASELAPGAQGGFEAVTEGDEVVLTGGSDTSTAVQALRTVLAEAWARDTPPSGVRPESPAARQAVGQWW